MMPTNEEIREDLREIIRILTEHVERIRAVEVMLQERKECPQPGLCLNVQQDLFDLREEVKSMELSRAKVLGGAVVIMGLATLLGTVGGWLMMYLTTRGNV